MEEKKILDTNILLDYPQIVTKTDSNWLIPMCVLKEIDGLKMSPNIETAKKARKAAVYLAKNRDHLEFDIRDNGEKADKQLLTLASENDKILITNDISLKVQAMALDIKTEGFVWDSDYTGIVYLDEYAVGSEEYQRIISDLWNKGTFDNNQYKFSINEYLVCRAPIDDEKGLDTVFRYTVNGFIPIRGRSIKNDWVGEIYPRNTEQLCLMDSLLNPNVKIVYAGGGFGTGKTFLTHNYAIRELENNQKKIIYVPNNSYTQNTMDLGALPGDLMEKILPSIGPLVDLVGIDQINRWMQEERLEVVPVAYIRGRNFDNSIVLVSEAENLTEEHVKLLLGRCGKDTKIFFDGDIHQADSAIFKDRNGLKLLLNLHESDVFAEMFATTKLIKIERSLTAAAADYLDNMI